MAENELSNVSDYSTVITVAKAKASELQPSLPPLPTDQDLAPFKARMYAEDDPLIEAVKNHLNIVGAAHGHTFKEHHEPIAILSAYVASGECEERGITGKEKDEIVQRAWRLGLLHDIERWSGWKPEHQIRGFEAADNRILRDVDIKDDNITRGILLHDQKIVDPTGNPDFDIPFYSLFAVDHLSWGTQWEESRWRELEQQHVPLDKGIHDYTFMEELVQSPNLQQTSWGKDVALPYIQYGLQIAKSVEQTFSKN